MLTGRFLRWISVARLIAYFSANNGARSASHQNTLKKMRKTLAKWIKKTDDKGQYPKKDIEVEKHIKY